MDSTSALSGSISKLSPTTPTPPPSECVPRLFEVDPAPPFELHHPMPAPDVVALPTTLPVGAPLTPLQ